MPMAPGDKSLFGWAILPIDTSGATG